MSFNMPKNAAEIAEEFDLPERMKFEAATRSFRQFMDAGLYRKALQVATKYKLPEDMVMEAEKKIS